MDNLYSKELVSRENKNVNTSEQLIKNQKCINL